jgi:hypothetical protein
MSLISKVFAPDGIFGIDNMMLSLYVTLGVFLLIAARHLPRTEALSPSPLGRASRTPSSWARWASSLRTSASFQAPAPAGSSFIRNETVGPHGNRIAL